MRSIFAAVLVLFAASGCSKKGPPPLTLEQAPAAIEKAFSGAKLQVKKNAGSIAQQIGQKQYVAAQIQLQALLSNLELSEAQREVLSSAMVAVNQTLQEQAASLQPAQASEAGAAPAAKPAAVPTEEAAAAAAAIEHYRATK